jgi:hypothetical protein
MLEAGFEPAAGGIGRPGDGFSYRKDTVFGFYRQ